MIHTALSKSYLNLITNLISILFQNVWVDTQIGHTVVFTMRPYVTMNFVVYYNIFHNSLVICAFKTLVEIECHHDTLNRVHLATWALVGFHRSFVLAVINLQCHVVEAELPQRTV